jgi:hypothetical protein
MGLMASLKESVQSRPKRLRKEKQDAGRRPPRGRGKFRHESHRSVGSPAAKLNCCHASPKDTAQRGVGRIRRHGLCMVERKEEGRSRLLRPLNYAATCVRGHQGTSRFLQVTIAE